MENLNQSAVDAGCEKVGSSSPTKTKKLSKKKKIKSKGKTNSKKKVPKQDDNSDSFDEEVNEEYSKQVSASDGFDVYVFPYGVMGGIMPIDVKKLHRDERKNVDDILEMAIKCYNNQENVKLELVRLVKVNREFVAGAVYYITFEAKDGDGIICEYQTQGWWKFAGPEDDGDGFEIELLMCRKKPSTYQSGRDPEFSAKQKPKCNKGCSCVECSD